MKAKRGIDEEVNLIIVLCVLELQSSSSLVIPAILFPSDEGVTLASADKSRVPH
jgi:hypothetical protein